MVAAAYAASVYAKFPGGQVPAQTAAAAQAPGNAGAEAVCATVGAGGER